MPVPAGAKLFLSLGGLSAFLAVALGAFGAHALKARLPSELLATWNTGVQYHFFHSLGLAIVGLACFHVPGAIGLRVAGWLMIAGIVLFSGSLYALALSGQKWLGAVAPAGGIAFLLAWGALCWAVLRSP